MFKRVVKFLIPVLAITMNSSCAKLDQAELEAAEQANIDDYLEANPAQLFQQKESGLYYYEVTPGTGLAPAVHDTACIIFTGKFLGGYVFDTNVGKDTFRFPIGENRVIPGFDEAVSYMKEYGKSICIIPSKLAYGPQGYPPYIPGYAPLLYEVKLTKVIRAAR